VVAVAAVVADADTFLNKQYTLHPRSQPSKKFGRDGAVKKKIHADGGKLDFLRCGHCAASRDRISIERTKMAN